MRVATPKHTFFAQVLNYELIHYLDFIGCRLCWFCGLIKISQ